MHRRSAVNVSPACFRLSYDDDLRHLTGQAFRQGMISRLVRVSSCGGWFCCEMRCWWLLWTVVVPWSHQQLQHVRDVELQPSPQPSPTKTLQLSIAISN